VLIDRTTGEIVSVPMIDKEFQSLIPSLASVEFEQLEQNILTEGIRDALVTWHGVLLDGHNRLAIAEKHDLPYETTGADLPDRNAAILWIVKNQLGRRNLTPQQVSYLRGKWYQREKKTQGFQEAGPGRGKTLDQNDPVFSTADRIASQTGVSAPTIKRDAAYAANIDAIAEAVGTEAKDVILTGEMRMTKQEVKETAALINDAPDLVEKIITGKKSVSQAQKELRLRETLLVREELAQSARAIPPSDRWSVELADVLTYQAGQRFDFIITDPPYPREYLELYGVLARRALEWLKPGGLLVAMAGQSYLDQIMSMMSEHLDYYWMGCYLTPGQPTPLRQRQVNTSWKPMLIYSLPSATYSGKIFGDVWTSQRNEKDHHKWGQSISGMKSLVGQLCLPGQSVFDPFCGAGSTGVAALEHGCLFYGIDVDTQSVDITKARLGKVIK